MTEDLESPLDACPESGAAGLQETAVKFLRGRVRGSLAF